MNKRVIKKVATKRERALSKDVGGRRHTGSGSLWYKKSDASDGDFQYEDKFTEKDYYTVTITSLNKIEREARTVNKIPVFKFGLLNKHDYVVLRDKDCIYDIKTLKRSLVGNKNMRLYFSNIHTISSISSYKIFIGLLLESKAFVLMSYKDFLDVKDKIVKGEKIQ